MKLGIDKTKIAKNIENAHCIGEKILRTSVIIPTFNRKDFVAEAVQSVLNQSVKPDEVIVVDDGSNDGTENHLSEEFGDRIHYHYKDNGGVSSARNAGISLSKGDLVAFLDSDDMWAPEKMERQLSVMLHSAVPACYTNEIWIRRGVRVNQMKKHQKYGGDIFEKCLPLCIISPSSIMLRRDVIEDTGLFNEKLEVCEDYEYWLRLTRKYEICFLDEPLIIKRGGHSDQLSHKYWGNDRFRVIALQGIIDSGLLTEPQRDAAIKELVRKCEILVKGFEKRNKVTEADHFRETANQYK